MLGRFVLAASFAFAAASVTVPAMAGQTMNAAEAR
ncbi:MAG: hypothetical protein QOH32_3251, partial [Bradyrhizobium sp.]|nr:hypothetical protein [Bradyrhizobium sp.]